MPLCVVCKGEYTVDVAERDKIKRSGATGEALPSGFPSPPADLRLICPRCGVDNAQWEVIRTAPRRLQVKAFFLGSPWGPLSIFAVFCPLIVIHFFDLTPIASEQRAALTGAALSLGLVIAAFAFRWTQRERDWLRQVSTGFGISSTAIALLSLVVVIVSGLVLLFSLEINKALSEGELAGKQGAPTVTTIPTEFPTATSTVMAEARKQALVRRRLSRLFFTLLLVLNFFCFSLATCALAVRSFGERINDVLPQPLFMQQDRFLRVVLDALRARLDGLGALGVIEMNRTKKGGLELLLRHRLGPAYELAKDKEGKQKPLIVREERFIKVKSDPWGRVLSVQREGPITLNKIEFRRENQPIGTKSDSYD